jgi:hypothetical protein
MTRGDRFVKTVYAVLAGSMLAAWLLLAVFGPRKLDVPGALATLRYGPALRSLLLILALVGPFLMLFVLNSSSWENETHLHITGVSFVFTSIIMALPLIEVTRTQVVVMEEGLTRFSAWSGPVTLKWTEIERIRYSIANQTFSVEGTGRILRVSRHLTGIGVFAESVQQKLASATWSGAAAAMHDLA